MRVRAQGLPMANEEAAFGAAWMKHDLSLRPITPQDQDFLYRVYASTREEELKQTGWKEDEDRS